jgi:large exoprotein involved in heme utilization and adhesion
MEITGSGTAQPDSLESYFTGLTTTTSSAGSGGTIDATFEGDLTLTRGAVIKADTQGAGSGGAITIAARNVTITDGGNFNSSSTGTGDAGDITITAADSLKMRHSSVTTEANQEADGGNIDLSVRDLLYLYYSEITSSVGGGPETTGGNITIDPNFVVLNQSRIVANAYAGTGGNIKIVADTFLADPQSLVDASSQLGVSGTVDIQAPINNISGLVPPLSTEFISASELLKERCIARLREGVKYSSFVVGGRDGLPIEPGNLLPSTIF